MENEVLYDSTKIFAEASLQYDGDVDMANESVRQAWEADVYKPFELKLETTPIALSYKFETSGGETSGYGLLENMNDFDDIIADAFDYRLVKHNDYVEFVCWNYEGISRFYLRELTEAGRNYRLQYNDLLDDNELSGRLYNEIGYLSQQLELD